MRVASRLARSSTSRYQAIVQDTSASWRGAYGVQVSRPGSRDPRLPVRRNRNAPVQARKQLPSARSASCGRPVRTRRATSPRRACRRTAAQRNVGIRRLDARPPDARAGVRTHRHEAVDQHFRSARETRRASTGATPPVDTAITSGERSTMAGTISSSVSGIVRRRCEHVWRHARRHRRPAHSRPRPLVARDDQCAHRQL